MKAPSNKEAYFWPNCY